MARTFRIGPALLTLPAAPLMLRRGHGPFNRWLHRVHLGGRLHRAIKAIGKKVPGVADDAVIAAVKKLETKA